MHLRGGGGRGAGGGGQTREYAEKMRELTPDVKDNLEQGFLGRTVRACCVCVCEREREREREREERRTTSSRASSAARCACVVRERGGGERV